jgi:hypothetical protein
MNTMIGNMEGNVQAASDDMARMPKYSREDVEEDDGLYGLKLCPSPTTAPPKTIHPKNKDVSVCFGTAVSAHYDGDEDDLEARMAKKLKEEEDLRKYHGSVMTPNSTDNKKDTFFVWMGFLLLIFVGMMIFGFVSGLFLPSKEAIEPSVPPEPDLSNAERQAYMEHLLNFYQLPFLEPSSPQQQAIKWLTFQDIPLDVPPVDQDDANATYQRIRLQQRFALAVWYFAQGGPKLWSTINRNTAAGWMAHGIGVHECDWHGIDCEVLSGMGLLSDEKQDGRVITGVRLNTAMGVALTGTSLSPELGLLTNVRRLDFSTQRLEGSIPDEWKAMTNLGE